MHTMNINIDISMILTIANRILNHITKVISEDLAINIRNLSIESNDGLFTGKLGIMVHDVQDIEKLCNNKKSSRLFELKTYNHCRI